MPANEVCDIIFGFKEKLTDNEFKMAMDACKRMHETEKQELYVLEYMRPTFYDLSPDSDDEEMNECDYRFSLKKTSVIVRMDPKFAELIEKDNLWYNSYVTFPRFSDVMECDVSVSVEMVAVTSIKKYIT